MRIDKNIIFILFLLSFSKVYARDVTCECEKLLISHITKESYNEKFLLAQCYLSGHLHYSGCERRPEKGAKLMEEVYTEFPKADPFVGYTLARLYFVGNGVKQDLNHYRNITKKLAENNYLPAMTEYGMALYDGIGGGKNAKEATVWLLRSSELGDERASAFVKRYNLKK